MRRRDVVLGALAAASCASAPSAVPISFRSGRPIVIAHRGASGLRPEHTMSAYRLAIAQGADFIEPDLVMTRDGRLICRHENEISGTTDIADRPEFADRRVTKSIDGQEVQGWFTEDFTLEELRTLRCKERLPQLRPDNVQYDGQEPIPTLEEVFALARDESARLGRTIGLYPEMKHPTHFLLGGLSMPDAVRNFLNANNLNRREAPVFVQCFEEAALISLRLQGVRTRLVFLVAASGSPYDRVAAQRPRTYAEYLAAPMNELREFCDGLGVEKSLLIPGPADPAQGDIVRRAHDAGLVVHAWTFRAENYFLPAEFRRGDSAAPDFMRQHGDLAGEVRAFTALGLDGLFTDFPAEAVAALA
ncbi:MAG: glycerophosphodiester phosphodiesterase [Hyphomonadaceae bacterium]